ncbi:MAG: tetratricopeptide repeat protein [Caldimonas sp.]
MNDDLPDWQARLDAVWKDADAMPSEALVAAVDGLADERPAGDPAALFERASVRDSTGHESGAEGFYRAALATGRLDPMRHSRAVIQLASTLRILGQLEESERLLSAQLERFASAGGPHPLHDETRAFLAFTWLAQGRAVEAAGLALSALAPHLSRYRRSAAANASEVLESAGRTRGL